MLGREPRLPHATMRVLIIALLLVNGVQLVLLQGTINDTLSLEPSGSWTYVILSGVGLLISAGLLAFAFARSRAASVKGRSPKDDSDGTVSSGGPPNAR